LPCRLGPGWFRAVAVVESAAQSRGAWIARAIRQRAFAGRRAAIQRLTGSDEGRPRPVSRMLVSYMLGGRAKASCGTTVYCDDSKESTLDIEIRGGHKRGSWHLSVGLRILF
jgi:hypothetical protein